MSYSLYLSVGIWDFSISFAKIRLSEERTKFYLSFLINASKNLYKTKETAAKHQRDAGKASERRRQFFVTINGSKIFP